MSDRTWGAIGIALLAITFLCMNSPMTRATTDAGPMQPKDLLVIAWIGLGLISRLMCIAGEGNPILSGASCVSFLAVMLTAMFHVKRVGGPEWDGLNLVVGGFAMFGAAVTDLFALAAMPPSAPRALPSTARRALSAPPEVC